VDTSQAATDRKPAARIKFPMMNHAAAVESNESAAVWQRVQLALQHARM
jgi:hypothetical protein